MVWYQVMLSETKRKQSNNIPGLFVARFWSLLQDAERELTRNSSTPQYGRLGMKILVNLSHAI